MDRINIILFICNWGPHFTFQDIQNQGAGIFSRIKTVRVPCTGRVSPADLLKAFEKGADGVALVGCIPGSCRYGNGTDTAEQNIREVRKILERKGMNKERLRRQTFLPDQSVQLERFLEKMLTDIQKIGSAQSNVGFLLTPPGVPTK